MKKPPKQEKIQIPAMAEVVNVDDLDNYDEGFLSSLPYQPKATPSKPQYSVEHYTLQRDLNSSIMASLNSTKNPKNSVVIDLSQENHNVFYNVDDYDDNSDFKPRISGKKRFRDSVVIIEKGQPSKSDQKGQSSKSNNDPEFLCEICFDTKPKDESFSINGCSHSYCKDCMANYVRAKLQENVSRISCPVPNCSGLLEPYDCRSILPREVFDRRGNALCEALILGSQKFYCPYKDCSSLLVDDGGAVVRESVGTLVSSKRFVEWTVLSWRRPDYTTACTNSRQFRERLKESDVVRDSSHYFSVRHIHFTTESECPNCRRLFCAQCKVPWNAEIECSEFQRLHKDERKKEDIMLMKLAENKQWRRCPKCRIFVERIEGCLYLKCRCGASFCYGCGSEKICTASHYCNVCKRTY